MKAIWGIKKMDSGKGRGRNFVGGSGNSGMLQLWPIPGSLWPFSKGLTKFPTKTALSDNDAPIVADAFNERMKRMSQPPYFGGQIR
jgi:hypothetical protein